MEDQRLRCRYAERPTARLRIPLKLGAGDVGVYFLQSPVDKPLGVVKCWVDDNVAGAKELHGTAEVEEVVARYVIPMVRIAAAKAVLIPSLVMIDRGVSKGSHFVECQLQGEAGGSSAPFKILGMYVASFRVGGYQAEIAVSPPKQSYIWRGGRFPEVRRAACHQCRAAA